jgi:hypothetical protein
VSENEDERRKKESESSWNDFARIAQGAVVSTMAAYHRTLSLEATMLTNILCSHSLCFIYYFQVEVTA